MNKKNIKRTVATLKEISKINQRLLAQILSLSENSIESFSSSDLKEIPRWTKLTTDILSSVVSFQFRLKAKLINLESKTAQKTDIRKGVFKLPVRPKMSL